MRILIWASALQADILALALHIDQCSDHELLVAGTGVGAYQTQLISQKRPFSCRVIERTDADTKQAVLDFAADVAVIDNHFPDFPCAKAICKMWHGLGWKAPDPKHMAQYFESVRLLSGATPEHPNPRFLAQCYGPHDMAYRQSGMNIHADNCRMIGMPFAELVCNPPYSKEELAPRYEIDVIARKTVLVNFTWHYGNITNQSAKRGFWQRLFKSNKPNQEDAQFLHDLCQAVIDKDANVLFCMHDRARYDKQYLEIFAGLNQAFADRIQVKFKDEHPDNLSDLLVADVMVSNLSSFITFFYHTGKPTVHLCPVNKDDKAVSFARASRKGVKYKSWSLEESFMTKPEDNGGFTVYSKTDCIERICYGLDNPDSCKDRTAEFLAAKLPGGIDGSCARFTEALEELHQHSQAALK